MDVDSRRFSALFMDRASSAPSNTAWRTLQQLSWADRGLFLEAVTWLAAARLVVLVLPFRTLSRHLGTAMVESAADDDRARADLLRRIAWAIGAGSRRAPWRCLCLEQGIAGKMMLRVRKVSNTLYLGVARDGDRHVIAHAWLRSGHMYLTGAAGRSQYTVVSMFADGTRE
jgi:hypothetical protein